MHQLRRTRRIALPALALAATLALTGAQKGCSSTPAAGGGGDSQSLGTGCDSTIQGPFLEEGGRIVHGGVTVVCKLGAKSYHHEAFLQYRGSSPGAQWELESQDSADHYSHALIVGSHCRVGEWRIRYVATSTRYDGQPGKEDRPESNYFSTCS